MNLLLVTIPQGVTSIDKFAFRECSGLTSVTIPQGIMYIKKFAFVGCSGLKSVIIHQDVKNVDRYAFKKCHELIYVIGPKNLKIDYLTYIPLTPTLCRKRKLNCLSLNQRQNILYLIMTCEFKYNMPQEMIEYILNFVNIENMYIYFKKLTNILT